MWALATVHGPLEPHMWPCCTPPAPGCGSVVEQLVQLVGLARLALQLRLDALHLLLPRLELRDRRLHLRILQAARQPHVSSPAREPAPLASRHSCTPAAPRHPTHARIDSRHPTPSARIAGDRAASLLVASGRTQRTRGGGGGVGGAPTWLPRPCCSLRSRTTAACWATASSARASDSSLTPSPGSSATSVSPCGAAGGRGELGCVLGRGRAGQAEALGWAGLGLLGRAGRVLGRQQHDIRLRPACSGVQGRALAREQVRAGEGGLGSG